MAWANWFSNLWGKRSAAEIKEALIEKEPTAGYAGQPQTRLFGADLDDIPLFTLWRARQMLRDPVVSFGLAARNALLSAAEIEVTSKTAGVKEYIGRLFSAIWEKHSPRIGETKQWGYGGFQLLFKENAGILEIEGLKDFDPYDIRAEELEGKICGFTVKANAGRYAAGDAQPGAKKLYAPRALWTTYKSRAQNAYGESMLRNAYSPWYEKWMNHGAKRVIRQRMIKDAYRGDMIRFPMDRKVILPNGDEMSWKSVAQEVVENIMAGGTLVLPKVLDRDGRDLVDYTQAKDTGNPEAIWRWNEEVNRDIWYGLETPKEIIEAASSGSGYSGRSIPFVIALSMAAVEFAEYLKCFDRDVFRPLVALQFGLNVQYDVKPKDLIESFAKKLGGSQMGGASVGGNAQQPPPPPAGQPARPPQIPSGPSGNGQQPQQFSEGGQHAPKGGASIGGKIFKGGEFIPGDVMAEATPEERAKIEGGAASSKPAEGVQSPQFQKWFGTSKVVDENGAPLVVYHGTAADFSVFDTGGNKRRGAVLGYGHYFTTDPERAAAYSGNADGAQTKPVYLSIQNPMDLSGTLTQEQADALGAALAAHAENKDLLTSPRHTSPPMEKEQAKALYKDKLEEWKTIGGNVFRTKPKIVPQGDAFSIEYTDSSRASVSLNAAEAFRDISFVMGPDSTAVLHAAGFDGVKRNDEWVAFRSSQIKSATGNRGTFDPDNPDINFSEPAQFAEGPTPDPFADLALQNAAEYIAKVLREMTRNVPENLGPESLDDLLAKLDALLARYTPEITKDLSDAQLAAMLAAHADVAEQIAKTGHAAAGAMGLPAAPPASLIKEFSDGSGFIRFPVVEDAIETLRASPVFAGETWRETAEAVKQGAFGITADLRADTLSKVREALSEQLEDGLSRAEFVENAHAIIGRGMLSDSHLAQVFRNNVGQSLADARERALSAPLVVDAFPYRQRVATHDNRVRPEHRALETQGLNGTAIYRADDPAWRALRAPFSWNCRCDDIPVGVADAAAAGVREAQEWLKRAEALADEKGGARALYFAETAPQRPEHVPWPTFEGQHILPAEGWERDQFDEGEPEQTEPSEFSSTQFNLTGDLAFRVRQLADRIASEDLAEDGREDNPHVTVKFGLHTNDAEEVRAVVQGEAPIAIQFGKCSIFPANETTVQRGGDAYDVVKIEVISEGIRRLNKLISDSLECTDTHPTYQPHITLAYVKPGLGAAYAATLNDLEGEAVAFNRLVFSDKYHEHTSIPLLGAAQFDEGESKGGTWITIGGQPEGDKKHKGGFPVQISSEGVILKGGPKALRGKHVSQVQSHFETERKARKEAGEKDAFGKVGDFFDKAAAKARKELDRHEAKAPGISKNFDKIAEYQGHKWDIPAKEYAALARELYPQIHQHIQERNDARAYASTRLKVWKSTASAMENRSGKQGQKPKGRTDYTQGGFDVVGRELAKMFPSLGWGSSGDFEARDSEADYAALTWELIKEEKQNPSIVSREFHAKVDDYLENHFKTAVASHGKPSSIDLEEYDPDQFAEGTHHAPSGGITIGGTFYKGGEFIPGEVVAKATKEERAKLERGEGDKPAAEPHTLTRAEFHKQEKDKPGYEPQGTNKAYWGHVRAALEAGKEVPEHVKEHYAEVMGGLPEAKAKPKGHDKTFPTAADVMKAGGTYGDYERPISQAYLNEEIDADHPAYQAISKDPLTAEQFDRNKRWLGQHVAAGVSSKTFGTITDVTPDGKSFIVTDAEGNTSTHSPQYTKHVGALIEQKLATGGNASKELDYIAPKIAAEYVANGENVSAAMKRHGLPHLNAKIRTRITEEADKIRAEANKPSDARAAAMAKREATDKAAEETPEKPSGEKVVRYVLTAEGKGTGMKFERFKSNREAADSHKKLNAGLTDKAAEPAAAPSGETKIGDIPAAPSGSAEITTPTAETPFTLTNKPEAAKPKFEEKGKGTQAKLFGTEGLKGEMNLFPTEGTPDDMVYKPKGNPPEKHADSSPGDSTKAPDPVTTPTTPTAAASIPQAHETPRQTAKRATKAAADSEYAHARNSEISNMGEDLMGSARHRANAWRSLAEAEENGTAEEFVTRKHLLRNEPHTLSSTAGPTTAFSHLAAHLAINAFPQEPGQYPKNIAKYKHSSGEPYDVKTPEQLRAQYYNAYRDIKAEATRLANEHVDPRKVTSELAGYVRNKIYELRGKDMSGGGHSQEGKDHYNPVANNLADMYKRLADTGKTSVTGRIHDFTGRIAEKYGKEPSLEMLEAAKGHVLDVMEGKSFNETFGTKGAGSARKFNPADVYVKHAVREGGRMIDAATVEAGKKHLLENVGLRGVQWGNYVSDDERQHHLKQSAEALADLADVTGLPDSAISLGGRLGLAIGARGHGGALAHYEPDLQVINLTRAGGVGSLAHEWGHAFDHYLNDFKNNYGAGSYFSVYAPKGAAGEKEVRDIHAALHKSGYADRLSRYCREQGMSKKERGYWTSTIECFARTFERHVQNKLHAEGRENTYLTGLRKEGHPLWPTNEEMKTIGPAFDKFFDAVRERATTKKQAAE